MKHVGGLSPPKELFTQAALLKRGWTKSLIEEFLPEPHETRQNPAYRSAAPMKLYELGVVEDIEASLKWREASRRAAKRRAVAVAAAESKRRQTLMAARRLTVKVRRVDDPVGAAVASYNAFQEQRMWRRGGDYDSAPASRDSDAAFLERITVNFLRHECTQYDRALEECAGRVGVKEAVKVIRDRVLDAVAQAYPEYCQEVERQKSRYEVPA